MERFIAIDSGKFATKVAEYNKGLDQVKKFSIRTKVSEGDFRDDAIEKNTHVVEMLKLQALKNLSLTLNFHGDTSQMQGQTSVITT